MNKKVNFHNLLAGGLVAQWITRLTTDQKIPGSNPGELDFFKQKIKFLFIFYHCQHLITLTLALTKSQIHTNILFSPARYIHNEPKSTPVRLILFFSSWTVGLLKRTKHIIDFKHTSFPLTSRKNSRMNS